MEQEEEPQQNEPPHSHSHSQSRCVTLPPGCRFHPSEELLLSYYLTNKNGTGNWNGNGGLGFDGSDLIRELDFYDYDPFELPDFACFAYGYGGRRRHWYCFTTVRVSRGERWKRKRKVKSGFWLRRGRVSNVNGVGENVVLGTRTRFVFYMGDSAKNGARTDWVLYEYALIDHVMASFVLCRVFSKPRYKNSASDIGLSCCAEESVSAVRHIGIQHDEHVKLDAVEAKVCDDISIDHNNEICAGGNSDNQVKNAHDIDALRCLAGPQGSQQLSIANFYVSNNLKSLVRNGAISVGESFSVSIFFTITFPLFRFAGFENSFICCWLRAPFFSC
ncbi:NAC domain-containing protein 76-like isoform X1 [Arachis stenosperma]|uniref:NAC domain-containing protein 76-like isoform X1 n=1 Tax=Arachis stenosperma TaxID=217475 RepID=UPI0025ABAC68|nr:NAC domain-containing protein 76-like isoform X1 [Arachis stenosperma]